MVSGPVNPETPQLGDFDFAGDDRVVPFDVDTLDVRGRAVQLGEMLDKILERHTYPEPVARLLAEVILLTVLLGTSLKFDGKFIVQTRSDGPVDMLVADFSTPSAVRAYARYDEERLEKAIAEGDTMPEALLGAGVLALTVDQGAQMQRYQGIVQLDGSTLEEVARTYFRQSEQIPTEVRLGVAKMLLPGTTSNGETRETWRAGGVLVQFLPSAPERSRTGDLPGGDGDEENFGDTHPLDNAWQEALALMATIETAELVDPTVGSERLLYRLFHEQGVRAYEAIPVRDECSCSRDKIRGVLDGFSPQEVEESIEDGKIRVTCEFCSTEYVFDSGDFS